VLAGTLVPPNTRDDSIPRTPTHPISDIGCIRPLRERLGFLVGSVAVDLFFALAAILGVKVSSCFDTLGLWLDYSGNGDLSALVWKDQPRTVHLRLQCQALRGLDRSFSCRGLEGTQTPCDGNA